MGILIAGLLTTGVAIFTTVSVVVMCWSLIRFSDFVSGRVGIPPLILLVIFGFLFAIAAIGIVSVWPVLTGVVPWPTL